jgi:hypothetical protein
MKTYWRVTIDVEVHDKEALYQTARIYLSTCNVAADDMDSTLRDENGEINVGNCLIMLLDRSEHLGGAAEILGSDAEVNEDDEEPT